MNSVGPISEPPPPPAPRIDFVAGIVIALIIATLVAGIVTVFGGCNPVSGIADKAYEQEQRDCVAKNAKATEIDACRAAVRERWGIVVVDRKDAGHGD